MSNTTADASDDGPVGVSTLLRQLLVQKFLLIVRYRVDFLGSIVGAYVFFAILFFGGQAAVGSVGGGASALGSTLDGFIVGWFLYTMAQAAYFSLASGVTQESEWGTFEQLYMSPYGFGTVMASKVVVNLVESVFFGGLMLVLMLVTTQRTLSVDLVTIAPVTLLALLSVVGLGFVFAGLALVYKRIDSFSQLMQFAIIGLIAAPVAGFPPLRFLPLVQGSAMLQEAMRQGTRLWEFSTVEMGVLVGTAVVYSVAGYAVFRFCSQVARERGVMGHY